MKNKRNNKLNENDVMGGMPMGMMPANGVAYTPDGRGNVTPSPVVTANNYQKAQVPTPVAAMGGMGMGGMMPMASAPQAEPEEEMEEEEGEEEDTDVTEVEEAARTQFKSALVSLLGEENASDSLISQLEGIFEAAVQDRVNAHMKNNMEALDEGVKNYLENVTETLVEKVDDYLDYVVEEWMQENTIAVEQGIKTQIAENFICGLKNLFENHYIDVPNEKYNALDELYSHNIELSKTLNAAITENINLRKEVALTECAGIFVAETRDLADTQVAKLQSLMENVAFSDINEYREKLVAIKENYLNNQTYVPQSRPAMQPINEEMTFSSVKEVVPTAVNDYVSAIAKLNKKL
jgi:hypothetical protein